jgi:hypothetical protein
VADLSNSIFGDDLWVWGTWDLILAGIALLAGLSLLSGGGFWSGAGLHLGDLGDRAELPDRHVGTLFRRGR